MSDVSRPLTEQEIAEIHDEPMLLHTWDAFRIIATLDALRAELAQVTRQRDEEKDELRRLRASVEQNEQAYLAVHEHWGVCKWREIADRMTREAMAWRKVDDAVADMVLYHANRSDALAIRAENETCEKGGAVERIDRPNGGRP